ncbi:XRE family transcriptional regulator [Lentilactobacillus senioris DSM 24302 = JCM 17472]|uniref:XRE family transcriptional regulator n=1 Tax=Lentilactobacillus senioris DSM 24302 = JCM 17472 TaxID=1423802 RepID=A0A0R2D1R2_9LACO|nr:helix-turn-helix domain-containing protein [Lentilactobacillus senioris]KRM94379.1 XRE family transcriptional regulator [Lentilactobacillus senioris DSM 24302 = JCM 17472]
MNIDKFIAQRKKLGYSQSELAKGICTQATISKFENNGKMISTKILTQLCNRLGLSLSDLFPNAEVDRQRLFAKLEEIGFNLVTSEYQLVLTELATISEATLTDNNLKMEYLFIKGFALALSKTNPADAIFCFDQILNGLDEAHRTIYSQLAYVGLGIAYDRQADINRARFYFEKVPNKLRLTTVDAKANIWKTMCMLFYTGEFYGQQAEVATSNPLLEQVIDLGSQNHVTYYVARAQYQLAENYVHAGRPQAQLAEILADATAFAKFNRNQKLLDKITRLKEQLSS